MAVEAQPPVAENHWALENRPMAHLEHLEIGFGSGCLTGLAEVQPGTSEV